MCVSWWVASQGNIQVVQHVVPPQEQGVADGLKGGVSR